MHNARGTIFLYGLRAASIGSLPYQWIAGFNGRCFGWLGLDQQQAPQAALSPEVAAEKERLAQAIMMAHP